MGQPARLLPERSGLESRRRRTQVLVLDGSQRSTQIVGTGSSRVGSRPQASRGPERSGLRFFCASWTPLFARRTLVPHVIPPACAESWGQPLAVVTPVPLSPVLTPCPPLPFAALRAGSSGEGELRDRPSSPLSAWRRGGQGVRTRTARGSTR